MKRPISAKLKCYRNGEPYEADGRLLQPLKVTDVLDEPQDEKTKKELKGILSKHSNYVLAWPMGGLSGVEEYTLIKGIKNDNGKYPELEVRGVLDVNEKTYSEFAVDDVKLIEAKNAKSGLTPLAYLKKAVQKIIAKK